MGFFSNLFGKKKPPSVPDEDKVDQFLHGLENQGVFIHQPFLWSFFFDDPSREALQGLILHLQNKGFSDYSWHEEEGRHTLQADVVQEFTDEGLLQLLKWIRFLAAQHGVAHVGDFEVGNVNPQLPLERDEQFPGLKYKVKTPKFKGLPRIDVINTAYEHFAHKAQFPHAFYVTIYYETDESGLPDADQREAFEAYEIRLKKALRNHCRWHWIYRMSWDGDRTNFFQVDDPEAAKRGVAEVQAHYRDLMEIHTNVEHDPTWNQALDMIRY